MVTDAKRRSAPRRAWILFQWLASVVLIFGILVLANLLSRRYFVRFDLTQMQELSLTGATRSVLERLDDLLVINAYISEDIPETYDTYLNPVKELLLEYRAMAGGNVDLNFIDPAENAETEDFVRGLGLEPAQFQTIERDRRMVQEGYCALGVFYRDQYATINLRDFPPEVWARLLEYELTRAIVKVAAGEPTAIGMMAETNPPPQRGQRPPSPNPQFYGLREHLMKQHDVIDIELAPGQPVPEEVDTLLVIRPTAVTARERFEIDQFLMRGGKVIFMVDRFGARPRRGGEVPEIVAERFDPGLLEQLEHYGVAVEDGLVKDEVCNRVQVQKPVRLGNLVGYRPVQVPFPYSIKVEGDQLDRRHPIVSSVESVSFLWSSPLRLVEEALVGKRVHEIARSSDRSWIEEEPTVVGPELSGLEPEAPRNVETSSRLLATILIGKFDSFFEGKEMPLTEDEERKLAEEAGPDGDGRDTGSAAERLGREILTRSPKTRIMVVGDADFVQDPLQANVKGFVFAANAIDWFTVGSDLISIRSRGIVDRTLREMTDEERFRIKLANIAGAPLLVALFGLVRFLIRRGSRRAPRSRPADGGGHGS